MEPEADSKPHAYGEVQSSLSPRGVAGWRVPHVPRQPVQHNSASPRQTVRPDDPKPPAAETLPNIPAAASSSPGRKVRATSDTAKNAAAATAPAEKAKAKPATATKTPDTAGMKPAYVSATTTKSEKTKANMLGTPRSDRLTPPSFYQPPASNLSSPRSLGIYRPHHAAFLSARDRVEADASGERQSPRKLPQISSPGALPTYPAKQEVSFLTPWPGWKEEERLPVHWSSLVESSPFAQPMTSRGSPRDARRNRRPHDRGPLGEAWRILGLALSED